MHTFLQIFNQHVKLINDMLTVTQEESAKRHGYINEIILSKKEVLLTWVLLGKDTESW
jgi:predicted Ser/Thr protein kinase